MLDEAWWFPAIQWPDGRMQFMLNERMMPSQFIVNGDGKRFINEAAPYMDFGHAMIEGQNPASPTFRAGSSPTTDRSIAMSSAAICRYRRFRRPGTHRAEGAQGLAGVRRRQGGEQLGGTRDQDRGAGRRNCATPPHVSTSWPASGHDDDFNRGDSVYDNYYGDPTLPNPNLHPLGTPPYYAFQIILGDLGTSGGLRTDEYARVLRLDDAVVRGLYAGATPRRRSWDAATPAPARPWTRHDVRLRRGQTHRRQENSDSLDYSPGGTS